LIFRATTLPFHTSGFAMLTLAGSCNMVVLVVPQSTPKFTVIAVRLLLQSVEIFKYTHRLNDKQIQNEIL